MAWVDKNVFFNGKDGHTLNSDARVMFHYPYTAVTPAMAVSIAGVGSDYGLAFVDSKKMPLDGSKTYKVHLPANPPAKDFWALTMYDNQTRSHASDQSEVPDRRQPDRGSQAECRRLLRYLLRTQTTQRAMRITGSQQCRGKAGSSLSGCTGRLIPGSRRPGVRVKLNWLNEN